mmetsp:Transcript_10544/g.22083  ORF Transcript_10544/g.22083 Transcript_10544/m.22083 type:complete len:108 (+) Transcript_10544:1237-1560(+)
MITWIRNNQHLSHTALIHELVHQWANFPCDLKRGFGCNPNSRTRASNVVCNCWLRKEVPPKCCRKRLSESIVASIPGCGSPTPKNSAGNWRKLARMLRLTPHKGRML